MLFFERKTRTQERDAKIYGSLAACAFTGGTVGSHQYEAGAEQMTRVMKSVLSAAGVSDTQVDYISAAANSTRKLDRAEAMAIQKAFSQAGSIPVSSIKGYIGDFCGSGTLRAAALLSMRDGKIPPTFGLKNPEFKLDHIMDQTRVKQIRYALLNGFSFGGSNVCLLFKNEIQ